MENKKGRKALDEQSKYSYENCWKYIIRPPRDEYDLSELELEKRYLNESESFIREDTELTSKQGYIMKCSFYRIDPSKRIPYTRPCVIYLHGNSSSRVEGKKMSYYLLNRGIDLFVFDFPGSGMSEGDYISLGYHEKEDVGIIVDYVEKQPGVGNIGIWGRSMGAATALMYSYNDERIKAQCVDSPFADFRDLTIQLCKKEIYLPEFIINTVLFFLKKTIKKKNDLDIDKLRPIDYAEKSKTPTFFIHAMKDELIPYSHTLQIYEKYLGVKSINIVEGNHNTPRQKHLINKIINFFDKYLNGKDIKEEKEEFEDENENNEEDEKENEKEEEKKEDKKEQNNKIENINIINEND
jgi:pimeloyl-ACP methyl ester carboxylesterase